MEPPEPVRVVRDAELLQADPTSGMVRRRAFEAPGLWAGQVVTEPGAFSGWHHHDSNTSMLYVVHGVLHLECEGVEGWVDAVAGEYAESRRSPCTESRTRGVNRH
jgi:quercetin dioxygenase-like cupin family protein